MYELVQFSKKEVKSQPKQPWCKKVADKNEIKIFDNDDKAANNIILMSVYVLICTYACCYTYMNTSL